jgi:hypothetical protein
MKSSRVQLVGTSVRPYILQSQSKNTNARKTQTDRAISCCVMTAINLSPVGMVDKVFQ